MEHEHGYTQMNTSTWMNIDQEDGVETAYATLCCAWTKDERLYLR